MEPTRRNEEHGAEISFKTKDSAEPIMVLKGLPSRLVEAPEKIKQLMDLLDLPDGTDAHVAVKTSDVIVR